MNRQKNVACKQNMNTIQPLKMKEILQYAVTWMNLEEIILSVTSQSQKNCMIPLIFLHFLFFYSTYMMYLK